MALALADYKLPGVRFVVTSRTPTSSVHAKKECGGVQILADDWAIIEPVRIGMTIAECLRKTFPNDWDPKRFDTMLVHKSTFEALLANQPVSQLATTWSIQAAAFHERRSDVGAGHVGSGAAEPQAEDQLQLHGDGGLDQCDRRQHGDGHLDRRERPHAYAADVRQGVLPRRDPAHARSGARVQEPGVAREAWRRARDRRLRQAVDGPRVVEVRAPADHQANESRPALRPG